MMEQEMRGHELPSTAALAYVGDAVHSLYVRLHVARLGYSKSGRLHEAGQRYVTAAAQAAAFDAILPHLTEDEADVARRARNSGHLQRPKHMTIGDYRKATALEAVLGMLAYTGQADRLALLMDMVLAQAEGQDA